MTEEVVFVKHVKRKPFGRKQMMDIAKVIRNMNISNNSRLTVVRDLGKHFMEVDPFFQYKIFAQLASGRLDVDTKTEWCSEYKEKEDDF